ncbi:LacI family DNA-binding transcriptional regulator [Gryllotalpicola protaetiae]|uniref:LacI family transcriptional regulator n=1 Tax=Gryllotalpicola protaetiae TaxID=2419771 RepID=A0A387C0S4_9MICO|nr:LacI family DNA-binding transcriptional regulator [Gryllotalpicola protaetiae]AYG04131.1 LacI family transcriptional regulator [Gryllotalpicola protaetiae]
MNAAQGPDRPERATLATIASDADVSMATVSKVLNGRPGVAHETRDRVQSLLQARGYSKPGSDRLVAPLVEIVFNELEDGWSLELLRGAEEVVRESGMSLVVTKSGDRHAPAADWIEGVIKRRPFGVILVLSDLAAEPKRQLRRRNIPFVLVDPSGEPAADVPSIGSANWSGGVLATKHLLSLGHRDIGVIAGPQDVTSARARLSGFRSAMADAGVPVREELIIPGNYHLDSGVEGGLQMLSDSKPPTAIFATNDLQALGVYEAARTKGLVVPDDLSVVGFDDVHFSAWSGPPLTTIHNPLSKMAAEAARLLVRFRDENQLDSIRRDLATSLIVRKSTAPLKL